MSKNTKRTTIIFLICLSVIQNVFPATVQLSGFVRDARTSEVLIGANVLVKSQNSGTATDNRGYFSLKINTPCVLQISYIGYKTREISLASTKDSLLTIGLEMENKLEEVTVTASRRQDDNLTRMTAKELSLIPTLGGKPDVIKALQLLPGVQTQSEGMSLMMVRGGEPGQNQYLLDNVPLIYINHLGGLFSVFNPDMINSVDFYKGNFPARQGGKLSSIVDITQREGDISKHQGSFSLGITDASFAFEGPLAKKMSYIVTFRKTLVDALLAGVSAVADGNDAIIAYGFHDLNAKLTWKPDVKNSLSLNLYQGDDYLNYWTKPWKMVNHEKTRFRQQWGNWLISGRWNRVFGSRLYAENIFSYSRYRSESVRKFSYEEEGVGQKREMGNMASVKDFSFRSAWKYAVLKNWNMEFGGHAGLLTYEPDYNYSSESSMSMERNLFRAFEPSVYIDNKINLSSQLAFRPSFRLSGFINNGETFFIPEPRINLSYTLDENHRFNLNYMRVSQSSHMVFAQAEILRREIWLPATSSMKPEISDQYSFSWKGDFVQKKYSVETDFYVKKMTDLVTLKEGYENMIDIVGVENKIETGGRGTAYGAELMLKKNTGKWTGSLSYAWSYADRQFSGINDGLSYEYEFNRHHNIVLNINRELKNNWNMNVVWLWQSGLPYTPAIGKYYAIDTRTGGTNLELIYGTKNSARMQPYHRLDIGFSHEITTRSGNRAVWTYSIYNVYNRINPYDYYYDNDNSTNNMTYYSKPLQMYKMGLFTIIPSISYKLYFDYSKKSKPKEVKEKKKYNWLYFE